jgi:hypothetical protein
MEEQTAAEWLMPNILGLTLELSNNRISQRTCELKILELFEQAKEMEKQEIKEAHTHNRCINNQTYDCTIEAFYNAEQYYTETFGEQDVERMRYDGNTISITPSGNVGIGSKVNTTPELGLLRELAECLQSAWANGNWQAETPNERKIEKIMNQLGYMSEGEMTMTSDNKNNNPVTPKPNNPIQASDEMDSRVLIEKKLWDAMVEWDKSHNQSNNK